MPVYRKYGSASDRTIREAAEAAGIKVDNNTINLDAAKTSGLKDLIEEFQRSTLFSLLKDKVTLHEKRFFYEGKDLTLGIYGDSSYKSGSYIVMFFKCKKDKKTYSLEYKMLLDNFHLLNLQYFLAYKEHDFYNDFINQCTLIMQDKPLTLIQYEKTHD